ncbi:MAG: hypothetical protein ACE5I3_03635 [Phycisphaerae bacterium]
MRCLARLLAAALVCALMVGCPALLPGGLDATDDSAGDVSETALNYGGTLSGSLSGSSTTVASQDPQAAQAIPLGGDEVIWCTDLKGDWLRDANGDEYPEFPLNANGTFNVEGLPVGVEIIVLVDLDGDGEPDLAVIVNIPKDADGDTGSLSGADVDPLSTLANAKLQRMLHNQGVDPDELDLSLSGLIGRTRDAYENLFEDAGIEDEVELGQIEGLTEQELAQYFEEHIPLAAQRGMRMAESNIALAVADDVADIVKAVAKILLEGGFVIADDPGGIDLSFLGESPFVRTLTFEEYHEFFGMPGPGEPPPSGGGMAADSAQTAAPPPGEPVLYVNTLAEVDRNYTLAGDENDPMMGKPIFAEHMLIDIAEVYAEGKSITLAALHTVLVDAEIGLGLRLTYTKWGGPDQPPVEVFESAEGTGIEKDTYALFQQISDLGLFEPAPEPMVRQDMPVRGIIQDFLAGTVEPSFERLFGGFLMERVPSAEAFARLIRGKRAHVPFSRSGPSQWFVVADADPFQNSSARAVTVDVETDADGKVTKVTLNPGGDGKFYLGFGPITERGMETELIRRSNGRFLHDHHGRPQFLEMADSTIFQNVNGQSFFEAFSERGEQWPGAPALRVPNHGFDPSLPPDPETNPPDFEAFVLMTTHGPDGEPVRVDYADGVATYNPYGQYYLLFDPRTEAEGLFALIAETGEVLEQTPGDWASRVLVAATAVLGIDLAPETFTHVFGIDVPNPGYDPEGAPYYDDINNNGVHDPGEPSFAEKHYLFDPNDWRSTWVEKYYRRADNHGFPNPEDIDWESATPALKNGVPLVPRNLKPRLNAFLFGRPNTAINLLTAFSPPEFFNGTQALDRATRINPFMAIAIIDLMFEQVMNVQATVDWDGPGGMPPHEELVPAWIFVPPLGDPLTLIAEGFMNFAD